MSVKTFKESPYFEETTWLILITYFLNVQYVLKQLLVSQCQFFFLCFNSLKNPVKIPKEGPHFEETTWLTGFEDTFFKGIK